MDQKPDDQKPADPVQDTPAPDPRGYAMGTLYFGAPPVPPSEHKTELDQRIFQMWNLIHENVDKNPELSHLVAAAATNAYEVIQDLLDRTIGAGGNPAAYLLARHAAVCALLGGHLFMTTQPYWDVEGGERFLNRAQNILPVAICALGRQVAAEFDAQRRGAAPGSGGIDPEIAAAVAEAAGATKN